MSPDNGPRLSLADLHVHTSIVDGIAPVEEMLDYVESRTSLAVVAITDHDTLKGAFLARELALRRAYRFEVVTGMELSTNCGHLLALFVERPVVHDEGKTLRDYVREVHSLGGLCILAHPMSRQKNSISRRDLEVALADPDPAVHPDGIEILDPRVARIMNTEDVAGLNAARYHLAELGNSDAHAPGIIGTRYTLFPGRSAGDLRRAIKERATRPWSGVPPHPSVKEA